MIFFSNITLSGDAQFYLLGICYPWKMKSCGTWGCVSMDAVLKSVTPLKGYRLKLTFINGSTAVVNLEKQVRTLRFARIAPKEIFATARIEGDKVVWVDGVTTFSVYCCELLDAMMMA